MKAAIGVPKGVSRLTDNTPDPRSPKPDDAVHAPTRPAAAGELTPSSNPSAQPIPPPRSDPASGSAPIQVPETAHSPFGPGNEPAGMIAFPHSLEQRYRLVRVLGKGGFANVYLAYDNVLDQQVAIKVLKLGLAAVSDRQRFLFEARVSAKLRHPNIATVFDVIQTPDGLQMVMEFYSGGTLSDRLKKKGAMKPREAIDVARQVGLALAYAHRQGIIHRDVKPANIFFAGEGLIKLGDFGIASHIETHEHTQTGMIIGTPLYMAPEQAADSRDVDPRTDIYALGLTLYHMLSGHPPRVVDLEAVPEPFRKILKSATACARVDRLVSCEQLIAMLDQVDLRSLSSGRADVGSQPRPTHSPRAAREPDPAEAGDLIVTPIPASSGESVGARSPLAAESPALAATVTREATATPPPAAPRAAARGNRVYALFALIAMTVIGAMGAIVYMQRSQLNRQQTPPVSSGADNAPDGRRGRAGPGRASRGPGWEGSTSPALARRGLREPPREWFPMPPPRRGASDDRSSTEAMTQPSPLARQPITIARAIELLPVEERMRVERAIQLMKNASDSPDMQKDYLIDLSIENLDAVLQVSPERPLHHLLRGLALYVKGTSNSNRDPGVLSEARDEIAWAIRINEESPRPLIISYRQAERLLSFREFALELTIDRLPDPNSITEDPRRGRLGGRRGARNQ
jgi:serine/threonine protein kinase